MIWLFDEVTAVPASLISYHLSTSVFIDSFSNSHAYQVLILIGSLNQVANPSIIHTQFTRSRQRTRRTERCDCSQRLCMHGVRTF